jgi:hypothetical protein
MIATPSPSVRRVAALVILVVLLVLAGGLALLPFNITAAQDRTLARLDQQIKGLEARLTTREQLMAERRLLARSTDLDQMLLPAETPALAGAELQRIVTDLVQRGGGAIESIQALDPEEKQPFLRISLRVSFTTGLSGLRDFLHAVDDNAPVLLVDTVNLAGAPDAGDGNLAESDSLRAVVDVFGFARGPVTPAEPAQQPQQQG